MDFKNSKVLVAGGTGLVGIPLVKLLIKLGAKVRIASLDDPSRSHPQAEFLQLDLIDYDNCLNACQGVNYVFNLLCAKGSPGMVKRFPATMMRPMVKFNINLIDAAIQTKVNGFLYTSSVGVYYPAAILNEDDTEKNPPPPNDFAGRAKLYGEWYATAIAIEHNLKVTIVRPSNIYGPYDNFDSVNATVIPSLIKRAVSGENPFVVWGDGSQIRDFIFSEDVARGMILTAEKAKEPVNLGSGKGVSIKELVNIIVSNINPRPEIVFDTSKPTGDKIRLMDITRARSIGFKPIVTLEKGIKETINWYKENKDKTDNRYDIFDKAP